LGRYVDQLEVFRGRTSWATLLRRPLLKLPEADAERLRGRAGEGRAAGGEAHRRVRESPGMRGLSID
jgi:hypothetical protein